MMGSRKSRENPGDPKKIPGSEENPKNPGSTKSAFSPLFSILHYISCPLTYNMDKTVIYNT